MLFKSFFDSFLLAPGGRNVHGPGSVWDRNGNLMPRLLRPMFDFLLLVSAGTRRRPLYLARRSGIVFWGGGILEVLLKRSFFEMLGGGMGDRDLLGG